MLDTVKLQLKKPDFDIFNGFKFSPCADVVYKSIGYCKAYNNPPAIDKKLGIYMPNLTLIKRGYDVYLTIEFSVQKIMYNDNLNEVQESDFEDIINVL